jgi:pleiotropic regulator 1
MVKTPKDK